MLAAPDLMLGDLLAEGGEGRVFALAEPLPPALAEMLDVSGRPAALRPFAPAGPGGGRLVFKQFRRPQPVSEVGPLVGYPDALAQLGAGLCNRVRSAAAWPLATVAGEGPGMAAGMVLPMAPAPFWLAHRDGPLRLATLSYLAGDPDRIEVAYGLPMPAPGSAERIAVVYALARLLEAWQHPTGQGAAGPPAMVHGDLSAKNVLWSLDPAPAVFVLDCDGARPVGDESTGGRAVTPNWDDPAVPAGQSVTDASDRYVLALVFLRVLGGAHFPVQARQRSGAQVNIDIELPRSWRKLPDMPGLWELCERSLSLADVAGRPSPTEWCVGLEQLLGELGASGLAAATRAAQGDPAPSGAGAVGLAGAVCLAGAVGLAGAAGAAGALRRTPLATVPDVVVRPVLRSRAPSTWQLVSPRAPLVGPRGEMLPGALGYGTAAAPVLSARQMARQGISLWGRAHALAARLVRSPGRRYYGLRRLAGVLALDAAAACLGLFLVGMVVSPWIGL